MNEEKYRKIEKYMLSQMDDSAHDSQHIYRVLFTALEIAKTEKDVDMEILITSCLLHDIGRKLQFENPELCHAAEGGKLAYEYLVEEGWPVHQSNHVRQCIETHRFRSDNPPASVEAKILFDADKIDVTGALGIARTFLYAGIVNEPMYLVGGDGKVMDGMEQEPDSFFREYNYKLKNLYDKFYTKRGSEIALLRRNAAISFFENMRLEVKSVHETGQMILSQIMEGKDA